jgi:hypothetical protein
MTRVRGARRCLSSRGLQTASRGRRSRAASRQRDVDRPGRSRAPGTRAAGGPVAPWRGAPDTCATPPERCREREIGSRPCAGWPRSYRRPKRAQRSPRDCRFALDPPAVRPSEDDDCKSSIPGCCRSATISGVAFGRSYEQGPRGQLNGGTLLPIIYPFFSPSPCSLSDLPPPPSRSRPWGAVKSSAGPFGTMPFGLICLWLP